MPLEEDYKVTARVAYRLVIMYDVLCFHFVVNIIGVAVFYFMCL
jgi:hypothetical protein